MKLSELIPFLQRLDVRPRKRLSQNFLIDPNICRKIVQTADVKPGDSVLEIGSGPGALTQELLAAGAHVFAVEIDRIFARELNRFQTADERLKVFETDFLEFPMERLPSPIKVVANLPYHITSPILEKLCAHPFISLTLMVQKELADRIGSRPGTKEYSSFTIFLQFYSQLHSTFSVSASCFYPRPKVDSTVIRLDAKTPPPVDPAKFFPIVRKAFTQRRKMIRTSLHDYPQIQAALTPYPNARPEDLSLADWLEITRTVS